ncbi:hypothetical protein M9Q43_13975 [Flavobacterium sp. HXWNR29]|uniref:hypothetical protein n=1 Tax=Flavobacterium odoriferum TaxID=2946604 RepID=UPI0021CB2897|nr:hypothetical protein [Flavobacterium sp. HXWNR29]MCU4190268.1 hypothetical protein [Flavobacterium sp. HXWNR29]
MKIIQTILFLFFSCLIYSTPQIPDILKYNDREFELHHFSPAHKYFEDNGFIVPKEALETTANSNIFMFKYEIINEKLFLTDVKIFVEKKNENGILHFVEKSVFKNYFPLEDKILMNISSVTVISYGETIYTEKYGWSDAHSENYLIFEFENGYVKKSLDLDYKKFKSESKKQFRKFKKSEEFLILVDSERMKEEVELYNEFRPKKLHLNAEKLIQKNIFYKIKQIE